MEYPPGETRELRQQVADMRDTLAALGREVGALTFDAAGAGPRMEQP